MPMTAKILLIEGKRNDGPSFVAGLTKKGFQVETFASGSAALTRLQESRPDLVVVNAATMRTSGKRICMSLRQEAPSLPIVLILDEKAEPQHNVLDLDYQTLEEIWSSSQASTGVK